MMLTRTFGHACAMALFLLVALVESAPDARAQCGPQWLPGDGLPGVNGLVYASTMFDPDGPGLQVPRLVVGGSFSIAGATFADGIAMWDGAAWSPVGSASPDPQFAEIRALAVLPSGELVAGGVFTSIGGSPANRIARWNGSAWLSLGLGLSGPVSSLRVLPNGDLVVGGTFNTAGGAAANNIARWNGTAWSPLGSGIVSGLPQPANVRALALRPNGDLIAGGHFLIAGGAEANFIAGWNGTSWYPLGTGMWSGNPADVYSLAVLQNGDVVAGGGFHMAGGTDVNRIARWDGSAWHPLAEGVAGVVSSLAVLPDGDLLANGYALWDGTAWSALTSEIGTIRAVTILPSGEFYAAGSFAVAEETPAENVAHWDGTQWSALSPLAAAANMNRFVVFDDGAGPQLFAAGSFANAGFAPVDRVAKWNGAQWSSIGASVNGPVYALAVFDDGNGAALYAGGAFTSASGQTANNIAKWNGANWSPVGPGTPGPLYALAEFDDGTGSALYAGGAFGDGTIFTGVGKWDGSTWSGVPGGPNGAANELAAFQGGSQPVLYVSGPFTTAGGFVEARFIAGWDGSNWFPLDTGTSNVPESLAVLPNGDLIAAAPVSPIGAGHIARWNGSSWSQLGSGVNGVVTAVTVMPNGDLIAAGSFSIAGGVSAENIARWNTVSWSALGLGLTGGDDVARALAVLPNGDLVAAGQFELAGGDAPGHWARWTENAAPWVALQPQDQTVANAATAIFSSAPANGYAEVTYKWRRNGTNIDDGPGGASPGGGTISGASGTLASPTYASIVTLTIDGAQSSDDGVYTVLFTNPCGSATSEPATLLVCGCGLADLDCDNTIGLADLATLLSNFGRQDSPPRSAGNLDGDSDVDLADLTQMLSSFGAPCN